MYSVVSYASSVCTVYYKLFHCDILRVPELETSGEQTNSQLKDERQLRKTYETQLSGVREEFTEWKNKAELLEKVSLCGNQHARGQGSLLFL